jgi:hypothetical protein
MFFNALRAKTVRKKGFGMIAHIVFERSPFLPFTDLLAIRTDRQKAFKELYLFQKPHQQIYGKRAEGNDIYAFYERLNPVYRR